MTLQEIIRRNREIGHYFFSAGAMEFFSSSIHQEVFGGFFFITAEPDMRGRDIRYTIRKVIRTNKGNLGEIDTVGEFRAYATFEDAAAVARTLDCSKDLGRHEESRIEQVELALKARQARERADSEQHIALLKQRARELAAELREAKRKAVNKAAPIKKGRV